ncbi:MAG: DUF4105 domain-containing protein [Desulfuromonadales bacterium]|nr:DUF4105 domain-containing protein [Desulfuromonadales bacterium]
MSCRPWTKVCGKLFPAYFFFYLCLTLQTGEAAPATAGPPPDLADLLDRATRLELAEARPWQVYLRYRPQGGKVVSLVDDPAYFLADTGKHDPQAELHASIEAMYAPAERGDDHFLCRFPARSEWLAAALDIETAALPRPHCASLDDAMAKVDPRSAVLVFPAAHNNGPASMFGHTLLRIGSSYQSELLSHAVNYAAFATDTNGLVYAFKGLFGFYDGYFTVLPYYEKLNEYNDLEHRDVWEYRLNLTPDEVRRLVLHTWELQSIASDYYFFDENCSFMLLFLLEAARPELQLAREYWERSAFWVIPAETIASVRRAGLVDGVRYRPSLATRIRHKATRLPVEARRAAHAMAIDTGPTVLPGDRPVEEQRQTLDLAAEFLRYRFSRQDIDEEDYKKRFLAILTERSRLGMAEQGDHDIAEPAQPESGHGAGRWGLGAGVSHDRFFLDLSWRAAYHDLLDPDDGFTPGAQINFFAANLRLDPQRHRLRLESLQAVDIFSLAPRDLFFRPVSWKVKGGLARKPFADDRELLYLGINTGGGLAWEILPKTLFYLMAEADLNLSDRFDDKVALGAGPHVGLLLQPARNWKIWLQASKLFYAVESHRYERVALEQNVRLARNHGLRISGLWERAFDHSRREARLAYLWYF